MKMVKILHSTELEKGIRFLELIKQGHSIGELARKFDMEYVEVRRVLHLNPEYMQHQKKLRTAKRNALKGKRMTATQK